MAAICIAPAILTNAGILKNKSVTGWSGIENDLKVAGANFTGGKVETDNNVITASGPDATKDFGQAIVDYLKNRRPLKNT